MAVFDVSFEGEHQETFDTSPEACAWASEAADVGRRVFVVSRSLFGVRLVAVFPPSEMERGVADWNVTSRKMPGSSAWSPPERATWSRAGGRNELGG